MALPTPMARNDGPAASTITLTLVRYREPADQNVVAELDASRAC